MNKSRNFFARFPDAPYLAALLALSLLYWSRVLFSDAVLLPGEFLRGFAPFGSDAQAPWNILQWDAMGQYFPWRFFAAQQLRDGLIPLWNPHQFSGTPFLANGQSAIFYPLGFPFWFFDTARAFGISAFLHTLLASGGAYFLARRWNLSRAAALLGAIGFSFCGYLAAWIVLPTLSNTASWLPLLLLLFERACSHSHAAASTRDGNARRAFAWFALALAACFLAGHPQIFLYVGLALLLRAVTLSPLLRALRVLAMGGAGALCLGALQLLPFLELMRVGHRAGSVASADGWREIAARALWPESLPSLFFPLPPPYSFDENKGYTGLLISLLALAAVALLARRTIFAKRTHPQPEQISRASTREETVDVGEIATEPHADETLNDTQQAAYASPRGKKSATKKKRAIDERASFSKVGAAKNNARKSEENAARARDLSAILSETRRAAPLASTRALLFCALLTLCGLLYATATPLPQLLYFYAPGFSQIGGVGRALLWWNFGAALLAAFALDALKNNARFSMMAFLTIFLVGAELFAANWNTQPTAPRRAIYPRTQITDFLQRETQDGARVLLLTPREMWLPAEGFRAPRTHPTGVLMTNGATVYGLNDVSGYDSLSLKSYRAFVAQGEKNGAVSPPLNGNILLLNNPLSPQLDALNVRFVVSENELPPQVGDVVLRAENCIVYRRRVLAPNVRQRGGEDFAPGFRDGKYQPQSFRFGAFVSLLALALMAFLLISPSRVLARRGA